MLRKKELKRILEVETKYGVYQCVFEKEKDMGGYVVETKGLQGALSWGKNMKEARLMIKEAIEGAVEANILAGAEKSGIVQIKNDRHRLAVV